MYSGGMPLSRGSGPLVPGIPRTSNPKLVPRSGGVTSWPNRVQPKVPSRTRFGDTVYVCPIPAICTRVLPSPTPPSQTHSPPASPRPKSPWTSASIALYLNQSWCRSFRFQLTLASMLFRLSLCVPELK